MELNWQERNELDKKIASLHEEGDVVSFNINKNRRIKFPRGFLRTFSEYRGYFTFLENGAIKEKIVNHMMHRDTLHWLWLKTDIKGNAREMVIKFQLINLAAILEGLVKALKPNMPRKKDDVYHRIDLLNEEGRISNNLDLKQLWKARNSVHLHLNDEKEIIKFTDLNYIKWHSAMSELILALNKK